MIMSKFLETDIGVTIIPSCLMKDGASTSSYEKIPALQEIEIFSDGNLGNTELLTQFYY